MESRMIIIISLVFYTKDMADVHYKEEMHFKKRNFIIN